VALTSKPTLGALCPDTVLILTITLSPIGLIFVLIILSEVQLIAILT
jgi:hypothetical protein